VMNALGHISTNVYDADGRHTAIVDPAGGRTTMVYSNRGEMIGIANPLDQRTSYTFDAAGQLATRQFANGDTTNYTFDANSRLVTTVYADGKRVTQMYDSRGNLTTMLDWSGTTTIAYDSLSREIGKTDTFGNAQSYVFDNAGQKTRLNLPDGNFISYTYDIDARTSGFYDVAGNYNTIAYDARNLKTVVTRNNGLIETSAYDKDGQQVSHISFATDSDAQAFSFTYDANGNRSAVNDTVLGVLTSYTFDAKDRITKSEATGSLSHVFTYAYDSRDNIINSSESGVMVTSTYDAASRLVTSVRGTAITTYTFNVNGNMTNAQEPTSSAAFVYDKENRLLQGGSGLSQNAYNGFGQLITSEDLNFSVGLSAQIIWDDQDNVIMQSNDTADEYYYYVVADGIIYKDSRCGDYMIDALGSVTGVVNDAGKPIQNFRYAPYGRVLLGDEGGQGSPVYRWTGNTGSRYTAVKYCEHHNRARFYSVTNQRWITRDPIWPEESAYGYVNGNPVSWLDRWGLSGLITQIGGGKPGSGCAPGTVMTLIDWNRDRWPSTDYVEGVVCIQSGASGPKNPGGGGISGRDAIELCRGGCTNLDCVAYNGFLYDPAFKDGKPHPRPMLPGQNTGGPPFSGNHGGGLTGPAGPVKPVPVRVPGAGGTATDLPTTGMNPGAGLPRTGGCVDGSGRLVAVIAWPKPPRSKPIWDANAFIECMKKNCPQGSSPVLLDGGSSTQVISWPANGTPSYVILGQGGTAPKDVLTWIVICK